MRTRTIGILTWVVAGLTALWVGIMVFRSSITPPAKSLVEQIAIIETHPILTMVNYTNAALITFATVAMLAGFYVYTQLEEPLWSAVALVFIPIYGLANGLVYLSQVFVVPVLLNLYHNPQTTELAEFFLRLIMHEWSGSVVSFVNSFAYTMLGIASIILGTLMYRKLAILRLGSALLIFSGMLAIVAFVGYGIGNQLIANLTLVSGGVYLLALVFLGWRFLQLSVSLQGNNPS